MKLSTHGFSVNSQLKHLFLQRYERYLPTAFDESMSLLEKMNKLIESQNKLIDVVNSHTKYTNDQLFKAFGIIDENLKKQLELFRDEMQAQADAFQELKDKVEGDLLPDTVSAKLEEWLLDGTIQGLILDSVFPDMIERIEITENKVNNLPRSVKDYGAVGDGVTDDTDAFKEAGQSGLTITIPNGNFIVRDTIDMVDNTHFIGEGDASKIINPTNQKIVLFRGDGSFGPEIPITQNETTGSVKVNVGNTSSFKAGDDIRIMSQRDAMSREDTGHWWMGVNTSSIDKVFLGEIKTLSNVTSNELQFNGGLIFPDYNTHRNDEKSAKARSNTTVQKVNFRKNLKVSNISVEGGFLSVVRYYKCKDSVVTDVKWDDALDGEVVNFHESYRCEARNVRVKYDTTVEPDKYYSRNALKTVSSYLCGFRNCEVINGSQAVDFTYYSGPTIPDVDSYLIDCTIIGATSNSATAHGGTYRSVFKNNTMVDCHTDGIESRANQPIIVGNTVSGPRNSNRQRTYGIRLNQGASINALISGNRVSGFDGGIGTIAGANNDFTYVGALITDNIITETNHAIEFRGPNVPKNVRASITVANNHASNFQGASARFVVIYEFFRGINFYGNTFVGNNNVGRGIWSLGNSFDFDIRDNVLLNAGSGISFGDVTDSVFTQPNYPFKFHNNVTSLSQTSMDENIGNLRMDYNYFYGSVYPFKTGSGNLGFTNYRWKGVYSMNAPDVASDLRLKENVVDEKYGLDALTQLRPVSYNLKDSENINHGLIAQEVEKVIKDGVVNKPTDDSEYYGMKYEELIPIIIKAIQELNDKIK